LQKYFPVEERHASTRPFTDRNGCLQCAQWVGTPLINGGLGVKPMVAIIVPDSLTDPIIQTTNLRASVALVEKS
jgi:hypothetical protein